MRRERRCPRDRPKAASCCSCRRKNRGSPYSMITNSCAQHLKLFRVRTQEKSCSDAKLSRVAGFRVCEFAVGLLSICQSQRSCRNVPFAMSSREVNIRTLQWSGAGRPKFAFPLPWPADDQVQYSCPTCGSKDTQRLSTVYMSGISRFSAVTSGFGWAGGPAGGSGRTEGISQTQLSLFAAPPSKRSYWPSFSLIAVSPLLSALAAEGVRRIAGLMQFGVRYNLSARAIIGGVGHPPQNLVDGKRNFQFGQQFFIVEFLHGREISLESKVVRSEEEEHKGE